MYYKSLLALILLTLSSSAFTVQKLDHCKLIPKWKQYLEGSFEGDGPILAPDNNLYILSIGLDKPNTWIESFTLQGEPRFQFDTIGPTTAPAISEEGIIYLGDAYSMKAFNHFGEKQWAIKTDDLITEKPLIVNPNLIVFASYSTLYAVNQRGNVLWKYQGKAKDHFISLKASQEGTIYASVKSHESLYALDKEGRTQWIYTDENGHFSLPAIDEERGQIYIASKNKLFALNNSGKLQWQIPIPTYSQLYGPLYSPTLGIDGTLYFDGGQESEHNAYAVSPEGHLKWTASLLLKERNPTRELAAKPWLTSKGNIVFLIKDHEGDNDKLLLFNSEGEQQCSVLNLNHSRVSLTQDGEGGIYLARYAQSYFAAFALKD